jgi:lysophospholipase L1-like esterase
MAGAAGSGLAAWGCRVLRVRRSVDAHRDYWALPVGPAGGLLYVAIGDSAAQGIGATSPQRGYVSLVADRLARASGQPVQVVNVSVAGAELRDAVEHQLPRLAALDAALITVDVGGNDMFDYDRETYERDVADLVAGLPPGSVVLDIPYFRHGKRKRRARAAAKVMTQKARAAGHEPVPLHDAMESRGRTAMLTDYAADCFHPSNRGHRVWADAVRATVQQLAHGAFAPAVEPASALSADG